MISTTVCFTGHRPQKLPWGFNEDNESCRRLKRQLEKEIVAAIDDGFDTFITGMALGTDIWCGEIAAELKERYDIMLVAAVPHKGQESRWTEEYKRRYRELLGKADEIKVLRDRYTEGCMRERNEFMVDSSSLIIAVFDGSAGGTAETLRYAHRQGKGIVLLDPTKWTRRYIAPQHKNNQE